MKKYCISFADKRMFRSLDRLQLQANNLHFFDKIAMLNEDDLTDDFKEQYGNKLIYGSRGYGYWSWKPQVITQTLRQMNDGDMLLYLDAGCHLNKAGLKRLKEYFEFLKISASGIIAFQAKPPTSDISPLQYDGRKLFDQPNYSYIKGDLFDHFGVRNNKSYTHAQAIGAGIILIRKCKESMALIKEWGEIISHEFSLLDDTPSKSLNFPEFLGHRHDQSIFSLLCIKYQVTTLSAYEYWYPKNQSSDTLEPDWHALRKFPIHAKRDKDLGAIKNLIERVKYYLKRAKQLINS